MPQTDLNFYVCTMHKFHPLLKTVKQCLTSIMSKSTEYSFGTFPHSFHYITFNTFINLENKQNTTYACTRIQYCTYTCTCTSQHNITSNVYLPLF